MYNSHLVLFVTQLIEASTSFNTDIVYESFMYAAFLDRAASSEFFAKVAKFETVVKPVYAR